MEDKKGRSLAQTIQQCKGMLEMGDAYGSLQLALHVASRLKKSGKADKERGWMKAMVEEYIQRGYVEVGLDMSIRYLEEHGEEVAMDSALWKTVLDALALKNIGEEKLLTKLLEFNVEEGLKNSLNLMMGKLEALNENYMRSQDYLVASHENEALVEMVMQWAKKGLSNEMDVFVARAVLLQLSKGFLKDANISFKIFMEKYQLTVTPLLQFVRYVLACAEREAGPLFNELRKAYASAIEKDPKLTKILNDISKNVFRQQAPGGGGNIFSNLMSMMANAR